VEIDLAETELQDRAFAKLHESRSEQDWLFCSVEAEGERVFFRGSGDATKLEGLILVFLRWANQE
jgi:hypothetical protein